MKQNRSLIAGFLPLFLCLAVSRAQTNTDLQVWVHDLAFSLTATSQGGLTTNGMIARTGVVNKRITSRDLIQAVANKTVLVLGKGLTNFEMYVTNKIPGPDQVITNHVVEAIPQYIAVTNTPFSSRARLLRLQPIGFNRQSEPFFVIRDGPGSPDYVINNYLQAHSVSHDGRLNPSVKSGRFDIVNGLESTSEYLINQFVFDADGSIAFPPGGTYFNVQGYTTQGNTSVTRGTNVIDGSVIRSSVTSAAGTGQLGGSTNFAVMHGTIALQNGRFETR